MNKIEQMNDAVRRSRERHDQIKQEAERKRVSLARVIVATIHELNATSYWEVYVAMHPRVTYAVFVEIAAIAYPEDIWPTADDERRNGI